MKHDPIQATSNFLKFEKEKELYSLRTAKGNYYWPVLRYEVIRVLFEIGRIRGARKFKKEQRWQKIFRFSKMMFHWGRIFLFPSSKYRYILYANSRTRNEEGAQYDLYQNHILESLGDECLLIESHDNKGAFPYKQGAPLLYPILILRPLLTDFWVNRLVKEEFTELRELLKEYYPEHNFDLTFLRRFYLWYRLDLLFYRGLFSRLPNARAVFFIRNNTQNGLVEAASERNILTLESIHGIMHKYVTPSPHIVEGITLDHPAIFPLDYMLAFSDYVGRYNEQPTRQTVVIGNDILAKKKNIPVAQRNQFRTLLVVPQLADGEILMELSLKVAVQNPDWQIIFKVKPSNFDQINQAKDRFEGTQNIEVMAGERNMMDLLDEAHAVLLTHSTTFYEALHRNVKCLIYKRSNYMMFQDNFELPNVHSVDELTDIKTALEKPIIYNPEMDGLFYQPFDKEALEQVLSEINTTENSVLL